MCATLERITKLKAGFQSPNSSYLRIQEISARIGTSPAHPAFWGDPAQCQMLPLGDLVRTVNHSPSRPAFSSLSFPLSQVATVEWGGGLFFSRSSLAFMFPIVILLFRSEHCPHSSSTPSFSPLFPNLLEQHLQKPLRLFKTTTGEE